MDLNKVKNYLREDVIIQLKQPIVIGLAIILIVISFSIGNKTTTIAINNEKVRFDELQAKIDNKEKYIKSIENRVKEAEQEISSKKVELDNIASVISKNKENFDEANKIIQDKEKYSLEIKKLQQEVITLKADIDTKKAELASVSGQIIEKESAPIKLSAGQYVVGTDLPSGRYKAQPVGRGSNLFVRDSNGSSVVNTILGNDEYSNPEYIFFASDGYVIETMSAATFTPVE